MEDDVRLRAAVCSGLAQRHWAAAFTEGGIRGGTGAGDGESCNDEEQDGEDAKNFIHWVDLLEG
ncbi:MAG: hypothetical protein JWO13_296 [Acidobacteriales bacterium]|nr:hypothetical protein [Terriglobales bacterium]